MAGLVAVSTSAAAAKCTITVLGVLPVKVVQNRLTTEGRIDGQPVSVFIDTGAEFSYLPELSARRLNAPITQMRGVRIFGSKGEEAPLMTSLKDMRIGRFAAKDFRLVVMPAPRAGAALKPPPLPVVVLGDDFFSHFITEFDVGHGEVRLLQTDGCRGVDGLAYWSRDYSSVDLNGWLVTRPHIQARILVNGKNVTAGFDTGKATSGITKGAAEFAGVTPWRQADGSVEESDDRVADSWTGTFETISIGGETIRHVRLQIADYFANVKKTETGSLLAQPLEGLPGMLIGCDFFLSHRLMVLPKEHKILFTYNGGPVFQVVRTLERSPDGPSAGSGVSESGQAPVAHGSDPARAGDPAHGGDSGSH